MTALGDLRVVHVSPRAGTSGVGDYAEDFCDAVEPHVGELVRVRHGGPGQDRVLDAWRLRRRLRALVADRARPTVVHVELSGGSFSPWWASRRLKDALAVTATVHDPPHPVWFPWRTRLVSINWKISHAVHYPTMWLTTWLERRLTRGQTLFTLTEAGRRAAADLLPDAHVVGSVLMVPRRPDQPPVATRPRAVGIFGHVYRHDTVGTLTAVREGLPADVELIVAGRGTETLPVIDGVRVLGGVEGPAEDAFFASVRVLLMPYGDRLVYGRPVFPASSVLCRAAAYGTPVVRAGEQSDVDEPGVRSAPSDPRAVAGVVGALLDDPDALTSLAEQVLDRRANDTAEQVVRPFLAAWSGQAS